VHTPPTSTPSAARDSVVAYDDEAAVIEVEQAVALNMQAAEAEPDRFAELVSNAGASSEEPEPMNVQGIGSGYIIASGDCDGDSCAIVSTNQGGSFTVY